MAQNSGPATNYYLDTAQVALDGTFSLLVRVPSGTAPGQQDITLWNMGGQPLQSLPFTVLPPVMSVSANSGTRGSDFTVSGVGYNTGETLTVFLGDQNLGSAQVSGAGNGTFSLPVMVPDMIAAGPQPLVVASDHGGSQQFTFDVLAPALALSLAPASGEAGAEFKVNVTGYIPGETVQVRFGSNQQLIQEFTVYTDATTYVLANVPYGMAPGQYPVTVVGSRTTAPQIAQYTVLAPPTHPQIGLSAAQGVVGTGFIIAGSGYTPGVSVSAALGAGGPQLGSAIVDASGTFSINAKVPGVNAGTQNIVVTAPGTVGLSSPFTVLAATAPVTTVPATTVPTVKVPATTVPVTSGTEPLQSVAAVEATVPAQDPTTSATDRGLRIQTAVQGSASAPAAGWVVITRLLGSLGLGLLLVVTLLRRRRA